MEKLMGYSPQDVAENSRRTPYGSSDDMDFNDVFGGPPRRYSMHEVSVRYSFGEAVESSEEDRASSPWVMLKEKPVFGEEVRSRRRRQGDDFFGDIFGGEESYSSPRKADSDSVFGSSPGSRIMSPVRPFTHKPEPYGTSLPAQFSVPGKATKASEHPVFASRNKGNNGTSGLNSPLSPSTSLSRFSNRAIRGQDEIRSKKRSPLSHEGSSSDEEDNSLPGGKGKTGALKKETIVVESSDNQFHFSIYKWAAGREVPMLIMPLTGRNGLKSKVMNGDHRSSSKGEVGIDHRKREPTVALKPQASKTELDKKDSISKEEAKVVTEPSSKAEDTVEARRVMRPKQVISEDIDGKVKIDGDMAQTIKDFLMSEELLQKGKVADEKENTLRTLKRADSINWSGKNVKKDAETGKVKEFVQIFSQEATPKPKPADVQTKRSQSFRWREVNVDQRETEVSPKATSAKASTKPDNVDTKQEAKDVSPKVDERVQKNKSQQYSARRSLSHRNNLQATPNIIISQESLNRDSEILDYADDPFEDNFEVEELSEDPGEPADVECSDDTKNLMRAIDAKIQQWSFGKKGNIRSLLSTLQYVLWPESGWKPVPLMDLIEGNSVKRAYQKALLRLHPDKLQQKGAQASHKYIAKKVFDILQEAWDHFNTLTPL